MVSCVCSFGFYLTRRLAVGLGGSGGLRLLRRLRLRRAPGEHRTWRGHAFDDRRPRRSSRGLRRLLVGDEGFEPPTSSV